MKKDRLQDKFLAELERVPIITVACEKVGMSRNTYYRWCDEDVDFALAAQERLEIGTEFVNDFAQSNVLNGIKSGDINTSKWWLSSRHRDFRRPFYISRQVDYTEEIEERERKIEEAKKRMKAFVNRILSILLTGYLKHNQYPFNHQGDNHVPSVHSRHRGGTSL